MYRVILMIAILMLIGCSSEQIQETQIDSSGDRQDVKSIMPGQERVITRDLAFPISDDPEHLSSIQSIGFSYLGTALSLHYKATGNHADKLEDIINDGFLMFWPRNVSTGNPVTIAEQPFNNPGQELLGSLNYQKLADDSAKLTRVFYKPGQSGSWETISGTYPSEVDLESAIIIGCPVDLRSIADSDTRYLLGMFGQLTNFLFSRTGYFHSKYNALPSSFHDLIGPEMVFIEENLEHLATLASNSDVVFKWGIDETTMSNYVYLNIDGVTYLKYCSDHSEGSGMESLETLLSCEYDHLDTSSPILTENNLLGILLDADEYKVSRGNIVTH